MKVQVLSDLHLEFGYFDFKDAGADLIIMAGDIHLGKKGINWIKSTIATDKPVLYVLGNHEYYKNAYPKLIEKLKEEAEGTAIHVLENDCIEFGNVTFYGATLWTNFELFGNPRIAGSQCQQQMNDYKRIRRSPSYSKLRSIDTYRIHYQSYSWLEKCLAQNSGKTTIIISHHAPSIQSVPERFKDDIITSAYASDLNELIEKYQPDYWFHGHIHTSSDYTVGKTRIICNPRGYTDEPNQQFNPELVITIPD